MFKPIQSLASGAGQAPTNSIDDAGIRRLFMVLHGYYGNLFLSKFATGSVEDGEDQGISNARKVWAYGLRRFDGDTIKSALRRCQTAHPEFPPSLPQFSALCEAAKPREVFRPPEVPAIAMGDELRAEILAKRRQAAREAAERTRLSFQSKGLAALKQAIARAVSDAGGDEVAELLRLDRMLAPKVRAA
jgi:hypothetical protein